MPGRSMLLFSLGVVAALLLSACAPHRVYNAEPEQYIRSIPSAATPDQPQAEDRAVDLAIIEFDDHGQLWEPDQLNAAIELIERRNAEHEGGVAVLVFVHGWKNNADFDDEKSTFAGFRRSLANISGEFASSDHELPHHVVGVFIGWRGNSMTLPLIQQLSFWDRLDTAERVASSLDMQETLLGLMRSTRLNDRSRCYIAGHSMGGVVVAHSLSPVISTLIMQDGDGGFRAPADMVVLMNPALEGLTTDRFLRFLRRHNVHTELRDTETGQVRPGGPVIVSITSETDSATKTAFPLGLMVQKSGMAFRRDHEPGQPSQRYLATHAEGQIPQLATHEARVEDGTVVLDALPSAQESSPFWIVRVTGDIVPDHSTFSLPAFDELLDLIQARADLFNTGTQAWITRDPWIGDGGD